MRPATDGLNEFIDTHLARLRFFRTLLMLGLVVLGVCCLQLPFIGRAKTPAVAHSWWAAGRSEMNAANSTTTIADTNSEADADKSSTTTEVPPRHCIPSRPDWQRKLDAERQAAAKAAAEKRKKRTKPRNGADAKKLRQAAANRKSEAAANAKEVETQVSQLSKLIVQRSKHPATLPGQTLGRWMVDWTAKRQSIGSMEPGASAAAMRQLTTDHSPRDDDGHLSTAVEASDEPSATPTRPRHDRVSRRPTSLAKADRLQLVNPARNGVALTVVVDGQAVTLPPGESRKLAAKHDRWLVQFHRGGDFGDVTLQLPAGRYGFQGTPQGWTLIETRATETK